MVNWKVSTMTNYNGWKRGSMLVCLFSVSGPFLKLSLKRKWKAELCHHAAGLCPVNCFELFQTIDKEVCVSGSMPSTYRAENKENA